jgi:hypothetical protein
MRLFALVVIAAGLSGCCTEDSRQMEWYRTHTAAADLTAQGLDTTKLQELQGTPDWVMKPLELYGRLCGDEAYRTHVLTDVWRSYWWNRVDGREGQPSVQWHESPDFLNTSIWVYDESLHFRHPLCLNWPCTLFCGRGKFTSDLYIARGTQIIAWCPTVNWAGRQLTQQPER